MLYESLYSGPKIDQLLNIIDTIKVVANGWLTLKTTETEPTDIANLINPGNFSTMNWINAPDGVTFEAPLHIIVTKEGTKTRQYLFSNGFTMDAWSRLYDPTTSSFETWSEANLNTGIEASDTKPSDPKPKEVWINTSGTGSPIQYYDSTLGTFVSFTPYDYMDSNIYNPDGIEFVDIYTYIENRLTTVTGGDAQVDFYDHIGNTNIHVTKNEKDIYNSKERTDLLTKQVQKIVDNLSSYISSQVKESGIDTSDILNELNQMKSTFNTHINNTTLHPNAEQIANWNSKAEKNHTHKASDIAVSAEDVIGKLSINNIPNDAKERQVNVTTKDDILQLTKSDVQNGDFVYLRPTTGSNLLYIVIDQTKLGTMDAFLCLTTTLSEYAWEDIQGIPTNVSELGLTDVAEDTMIDNQVSETQTEFETVNESLGEFTEVADGCTSDRIIDTGELETSIDSIDMKLYLTYNCVFGTKDIVNSLENITQ